MADYLRLPSGNLVSMDEIRRLDPNTQRRLLTAAQAQTSPEMGSLEQAYRGAAQGALQGATGMLGLPAAATGALSDFTNWITSKLPGDIPPIGNPLEAFTADALRGYWDQYVRETRTLSDEELGPVGRIAEQVAETSPYAAIPFPGSAVAAARTAAPVTRAATADVGELAGAAVANELIDPQSTAGQIAADIAGGFGGRLAADLAADATRAAGGRLGVVETPPELPTIRGIDQGDVLPEQAVQQAQATMQELVRRGARVPEAVARDIRATEASRTAAGITSPATLGQLTDAPGVQTLETLARARQPEAIRAMDMDAQMEAARQAGRLGPGGDPALVRQTAEERALAAQQTASQLEQAGQSGVEIAQRDLAGTPLLSETPVDARRRVHEAYEDARTAVRGQRDELYDAIDPTGTRLIQLSSSAPPAPIGSTVVNTGMGTHPLLDAAEQVRATATRIGGDAAQAWRPVVDDLTRFVDEGYIPVEELRTLNTRLAGALDSASGSGNPIVRKELFDQLRTMKDSVRDTFDSLATTQSPLRGTAATETREAAQAARAFNRDVYVPRFQEGVGGTLELERRQFRAGRRPEALEPSQTAGRFIQKDAPEKAQDLARIVNSAPDPVTANTAVRDYLVSDLLELAQRGDAGTLNQAQVANWRRTYGDALDQFPDIRDEVDVLIREARQADQSVARALDQLSLNQAERDRILAQLEADPVQLFRERNQENAVKAILGSQDPQRTLRQAVASLQGNPDALAGLQQAFADHLSARIRQSRPVDASEDALSYAKVDRLIRQYDPALRELYGPEQMQNLTRIRNITRDLARANKRVLAGSQTFERQAAENVVTAAQVGIRLHFGLLKGGAIMKTARDAYTRLARNQKVTDFDTAVKNVMDRAVMDPELAARLLETPVSSRDPTRMMPWAVILAEYGQSPEDQELQESDAAPLR